MIEESFIVICRDDKPPKGRRKGQYLLATRQLFPTREDAEAYLEGINSVREPLVVAGRWKGLRFIVGSESE